MSSPISRPPSRNASRIPTGALFLVAAFVLVLLGGCATTQDYAQLARAGTAYADALNGLLLVARDTAVDSRSMELVHANSFANRKGENFYAQEVRRLSDMNEVDARRVEVFQHIQQHVLALSRYFTQLQELATTDEPARTAESMKTTAAHISELTEKLTGQRAFVLTDAAKKRIDAVTRVAIGLAQRKALRERLEADYPVLDAALRTHEELLAVIRSDLEHDTNILRDREIQVALEGPFTAKTPLASSASKTAKWVKERRRILTQPAAIKELDTAARAAGELRGILEKIARNETDALAAVEALLTELEAVRSALEALT